MAADRAALIASAEAAISDSDLDELARRLCVVLRDAWLRQRGESTPQNAEGRAAFRSATRPPSGQEERRAPNTRPAVIVSD